MALFQRSNSVGLDSAIIEFQNHMTTSLAFINWNNFDRVYLNEKNPTGLIPEYYDGNGDYQNVMYNDEFDVSSFFFQSSEDVETENGYECDVALIVQCDLPKLFPSILHRGDQELARLFKLASSNYHLRDDFKLADTEYQINNVYREFDKKLIKFDDISDRHVVRFNYKVLYRLKCQ